MPTQCDSCVLDIVQDSKSKQTNNETAKFYFVDKHGRDLTGFLSLKN